MTVTFKHYTDQSMQNGGSLLGIFRSTDSESRALFLQTPSLLIAGQSAQIHFLHIFPVTNSTTATYLLSSRETIKCSYTTAKRTKQQRQHP